MQHRVRVAAVAYTAGSVGLLLALVAAALATGHTSSPDPAPLVFRPVAITAPSAPPSQREAPELIYEPTAQIAPRAKPKVPAVTGNVRTLVKATPRPKASAKPRPKPAPKAAPKPAPRPAVPSVAYARSYALSRIGSTQFSCLDRLFDRESGWNTYARNSSTGAYGIPQALPGDKMASIAADWRYNPVTQVRWGLSYIAGRYGTACSAWSHSLSYGWY